MMKSPQEIIDQYPYLGAFLSSAQGNEAAIMLMREYAKECLNDLLEYVQEMRESGDTDLRQIIHSIQMMSKND